MGFSKEEEVKESHKDLKMNFRSKRSEVFMAWDFDKVKNTPEKLNRMAVKVFSKYQAKDIREWSKKYLLQYAHAHAVEPPINLVKFKPDKLFANSDELNVKTKYFKSLDEKESSDFPETIIDIGEKKLNEGKESQAKIQITYEIPQVVANLNCRMPFTYYVGLRIFEEIAFRLPTFAPKNHLDFGAGLGSQVW